MKSAPQNKDVSIKYQVLRTFIVSPFLGAFWIFLSVLGAAHIKSFDKKSKSIFKKITQRLG